MIDGVVVEKPGSSCEPRNGPNLTVLGWNVRKTLTVGQFNVAMLLDD